MIFLNIYVDFKFLKLFAKNTHLIFKVYIKYKRTLLNILNALFRDDND